MSDTDDPTQTYRSARADFDARWEAAMSLSQPGEVKVVQTVAEDALLDGTLARVGALAQGCAERELIDGQQRDAILAAVEAIRAGFAGIARADLAGVMRATGSQPPQAPPGH